MSGAKIIEGANQVVTRAKATIGGKELPTEMQYRFLSHLSLTQPYVILGEYSFGSLAMCERLGWARMIDGGQWLLTEAGRVVLETRVHEPAP